MKESVAILRSPQHLTGTLCDISSRSQPELMSQSTPMREICPNTGFL